MQRDRRRLPGPFAGDRRTDLEPRPGLAGNPGRPAKSGPRYQWVQREWCCQVITKEIEFLRPTSLPEALGILARRGRRVTVLSGGMQSLMPMMNLGIVKPEIVMSLNGVSDLDYVETDGADLRIGAMVRHHRVKTDADIKKHAPMLAQAASSVGDVQVRNRGTIGGSICHADPSADYMPVLAVSGAKLVLSSSLGERTVGVDEFFIDVMFTTRDSRGSCPASSSPSNRRLLALLTCGLLGSREASRSSTPPPGSTWPQNRLRWRSVGSARPRSCSTSRICSAPESHKRGWKNWATVPTRLPMNRPTTCIRMLSTGVGWRESLPAGDRSGGTSIERRRTQMKATIQVTVNGKEASLEVDTRMILADMLRDELRLTGLHVGCATGNCGACTVMIDGRTIKSCCVLAADVVGQHITTIESLSTGIDDLHPIQEAFIDNQGLQCGFCTPGMILSTVALLEENPDPTEDEIRHAISGNLCRCTGYHFIVDSILDAAGRIR